MFSKKEDKTQKKEPITKVVQKETKKIANVRSLVGVFLLSLLAVPVCILLSSSHKMEDPFLVFLAGVIICFVGIPFLVWALLIRSLPTQAKRNVFYYMFTIFAFTSVVDIVLGLTLDGFIDTLRFYLENGEPYLKSPHGCMINYWDGTVQYGLYIFMTYKIASEEKIGSVGFFWAGSILNSLVVFLPTNVIGPWGHEVSWAYLLNIPFAVFPIVFLLQLLRTEHSLVDMKPASDEVCIRRSLLLPKVFFVIYFIVIITLSFFRLMVIGSAPWRIIRVYQTVEPYIMDPSLYPMAQILVYGFYLIPFCILAIWSIWNDRVSDISYLTAFITGAVSQGQFSYIGAALHALPLFPTPGWTQTPTESVPGFLLINIIVVMGPLLFLWYTHNNDQQQGISIKRKSK